MVRWFSVVVIAGMSAGACRDANTDERIPAVTASLPEPTYLSPTARALLAKQMHRHGDRMVALTTAVVTLNYAEAAQRAQEVANAPTLAKPRTADATELNAALPPEFFQHQTRLSAEAQALTTAARSEDDAAITRRYSNLISACVGCHAAYLRGSRP